MEKIATRKSFGMALEQLGEKYPQVVCLDADLSKSTQSQMFAKKFPNRFFEMGIQEANMIGVAAGMSFAGKIPFICSFAAFLTGRFDQIRMSIGYAEANVKLIGTHAGVGIGEDGHSQMGLEDLALMRSIPNMVVLQPGDHEETLAMMEWAIKHEGPVYLRLTRQGLPQHQIKTFEPGVFPEIKSGSKIAFFASGGPLPHALEASKLMKDHDIAVYNMSTIKPLNDQFMSRTLAEFETVFVFEDHSIYGGAASSIAEWSAKQPSPTRIIPYGVNDIFGESGTPEDLYKKHGFTAELIK